MGVFIATIVLLIVGIVQAPEKESEFKVAAIFAAGWIAGAVLDNVLGVSL